MIIVPCNGQPDWSDVNWWDHLTQVEGGLHFELQHHKGINCIVIGLMYTTKTIHQAVYQGFDGRWMIIFFMFKMTDVDVTWVLSSWAIPVCGED